MSTEQPTSNQMGQQSIVSKPSPEEVDALADELVEHFNNPSFRTWYCDAINKLGTKLVIELRTKAITGGRSPGRYFSYLIGKALDEVTNTGHVNPNTVYYKRLDTIYTIGDNPTPEQVNKFVSSEIDKRVVELNLENYHGDSNDA